MSKGPRADESGQHDRDRTGRSHPLFGAIVFGLVAAVLFLTARSLGVIFRNHGGGDLVANAGRNERAQVDDARRTRV